MREDKIEVLAPQKWMDGWNGMFERENEANNEQLGKFMVNYNVQNLTQLLIMKNVTGLSILDMGCGSGKEACYLAKIGRVVAFDALNSAIEVANRRAELLGPSKTIKFVVADLLSWRIKRGSYDIIVAIQSLQYLFEHTMDKIREILLGINPGGYFVYSGNILPHFSTDPEIRFVTKIELEELLRGWTIHSITTEERLMRPGDLRGFIGLIAQKPEANE